MNRESSCAEPSRPAASARVEKCSVVSDINPHANRTCQPMQVTRIIEIAIAMSQKSDLCMAAMLHGSGQIAALTNAHNPTGPCPTSRLPSPFHSTWNRREARPVPDAKSNLLQRRRNRPSCSFAGHPVGCEARRGSGASPCQLSTESSTGCGDNEVLTFPEWCTAQMIFSFVMRSFGADS